MQRKLLFTYMILIIFVSLVTSYFALHTSEEYYNRHMDQELITQGKLLIELLHKEEVQADMDFQSFSAKQAMIINKRITIIDENGIVVGDSAKNPNEMENHSARPEFLQAAKGQIGINTRYSESVGMYFLYVAIPVQMDDFSGVIRLCVPLTEIQQLKLTIIRYSMIGITMGSIIAMMIAYLFARKFAEPIDQLTQAVGEVSKGNYNKKIYIQSRDQVGQLADAFNTMSRELKYTIAELRDRNTKLESIVNSMINGIIAVDADYQIILINPICYMLFAIQEEDVHGKPFYEVIRNQPLLQILERSIQQQEYVVEEFPFHGQQEKILRVYANPILSKYTDIKGIGTLLVIQDVTQIRKLEKMRSEFVASVSHELKTPLTSIRGFIDTLRNGALEDKKVADRFLEIIDIEAERLHRLIQDILSLSEIETRDTDVNMNRYAVEEIIREVMLLLNPTAEEKGIQLHVDMEDSIALYCNKDRIKQMLINLIDNAIKYTEEGMVQVKCRKLPHAVQFTIIDSGIGIPKEHIPRLFERFYRVDKGRSRKVGGTGLGLSIVKHIVKLYDGELTVDSQMGKGSTFTVVLPSGFTL